jgi:hypothetical protein
MIVLERFWNYFLMPPRWRLTVYFADEEPLKVLEAWAAEENRSTSNLAATLLLDAIKQYQQQNEPPSSGTTSSKDRGKKKRGGTKKD